MTRRAEPIFHMPADPAVSVLFAFIAGLHVWAFVKHGDPLNFLVALLLVALLVRQVVRARTGVRA